MEIVRVMFGSHLYGTATPASDIDIKSVFVPSARDILLQRAGKTVRTGPDKAPGQKNAPGDVDIEQFSLKRYLDLLAQGQTVALDMLFAPPAMCEIVLPEWEEIVANRARLISRRSAAFVGYCQQQANKYGIKGSRVSAARTALAMLKEAADKHGAKSKLEAARADLPCLYGDHITLIPAVEGVPASVDLLEVCGRKLPLPASIESAITVMQRLVDEYGQRALAAEQNMGVDWKALSHAVRVGGQAIELLNTGHITFPLPNAEYIMRVKGGQIPYADVAAEIEALLVDVEEAERTSTVREAPDLEWIEDFICETYRKRVLAVGEVTA